MGEREIKGFALAPLPVVVPVLIMCGAILLGSPAHAGDAFIVMFQSLALIYGITLVIGLPVHLVLRRKRQKALRSYLGLTVMIVILVAGAAAIGDRPHPVLASSNPHALHMRSALGIWLTLAFALLASLSTSIFWSVAVRQPAALKLDH